MSGELEVKLRKRSGSSRSSRGSGSSFKGAGKGGTGEDSSSALQVVGSTTNSSSAKEKVDVAPKSSSGKGGNSSSQPHHQPEKSYVHQTTSLGPGSSKDVGATSASSSSFASRLSLKSLKGRKSPVRAQFNLGNTTTSTDQLPPDSISALASKTTNTTSCVGVRGGTSSEAAAGSSSCVTNNNNNSDAGNQSSSFRALSIKSGIKPERGASASPPLQRTYLEPSSISPLAPALSSISLPPNKESFPSVSPSTNPIPGLNLSTKTETEPADPNIPWIPGTSAPISVDRAHSVKITRKILHNWRSACGRTKDRTKDLIRRWKTLPENHSDFDKCPNSPGTSKKVSSTSNLNNNTSGSPGLGKKNKVDKGGKSEGGVVDKASSGVETATTHIPRKNESPKKAVAPVPSNSGNTTTAAQQSSIARTPELQSKTKTSNNSSNISGSGGGPKSGTTTSNSTNTNSQPRVVSFQTQPSLAKDNEMPAIGMGKGSNAGDGSGGGQSGGTSNVPSGLGGRLGSVGLPGIGRPSISVNSAANLINGRTGLSGSTGLGGLGSGSSTGLGGAHTDPHKSTGWTVHVWATYVQRDDLEQGLECEEPKKPDRDHLSDFQKVKLTHFFRHVLDMNHDDVISAEDFVALNQRIRHYIEWSSECIEFHILKEVHSGFLECFLNQPLDDSSETRHHVNIDEWLDVWGGLLHSARTMESLPLWLQYFPKILFQVINKSGSGTISREELRAFYTMFLGIDFRVVNETLESIHKAMTDGGRHKITYDLFKLCFANFLLGKYPNGPGQYLFGICSPQTLECSFPIDYSALNTHPDDLEPYDPEKDKSQKAMTITSPKAKPKLLKR